MHAVCTCIDSIAAICHYVQVCTERMLGGHNTAEYNRLFNQVGLQDLCHDLAMIRTCISHGTMHVNAHAIGMSCTSSLLLSLNLCEGTCSSALLL